MAVVGKGTPGGGWRRLLWEWRRGARAWRAVRGRHGGIRLGRTSSAACQRSSRGRSTDAHIRQAGAGASLVRRGPVWAGSGLGRGCHACGRPEHCVVAVGAAGGRVRVAGGRGGEGEGLEGEEGRGAGVHGGGCTQRSLLVAGGR